LNAAALTVNVNSSHCQHGTGWTWDLSCRFHLRVSYRGLSPFALLFQGGTRTWPRRTESASATNKPGEKNYRFGLQFGYNMQIGSSPWGESFMHAQPADALFSVVAVGFSIVIARCSPAWWLLSASGTSTHRIASNATARTCRTDNGEFSADRRTAPQ
jgi:hypothetical protein